MTAKIDGTNGVLQQYDYQAPTTGFSYTFAAGTTVLVMNPAGTLASGTIIMPAAPVDGMTISFSSTQTITALTVSGSAGQSIVGNPNKLLAGGAATFVYRLSNTTWYAQTSTATIGTVQTTGVPALNVYTSPGTYDATTAINNGLKAIKVTVVGGGGAGGAASSPNIAPGGGGGGTAIRVYPAPSLPGPQPYTVGAAGSTSSFGVAPVTVITATGGSAGGGVNQDPGAGGSGSNGQANMTGGGGSVAANGGGAGGSSSLGGGGAGKTSVAGPGSNPGGAYGGGGSGGASVPGGTGAAGVVIVEEFY